MTGEGILVDSELLYLPDHINICDTSCVNPQWRGGFPLLIYDLAGMLHSQRKRKIQKLDPFSRGKCFLITYLFISEVWYFSNNPLTWSHSSLLLAIFVHLESSALSCPVHPCPSTFWVLCVQISTLQLSLPNTTHSSHLSQPILIPFSTRQPFPAHPRPSSSSSPPIPWLLVQGTSTEFSVHVHSLHSFPGPCKVSRFSGNLFNQSVFPLYLSCSFCLIPVISYASQILLSSHWLSFSDSALFL